MFRLDRKHIETWIQVADFTAHHLTSASRNIHFQFVFF